MPTKFANNAHSTLASSINASVLTFTVATGHGSRFPALASGDHAYVTLVNAAGTIEIVKVTARAGDVFTIPTGGRGQDGTSAASWLAGDLVEMRLPRKAIQDIMTEVGVENTVGYYGAQGDWTGSTGTDDTLTLRTACVAAQTRGGGVMAFFGKRFRIYNDTGDIAPIGDFSNLKGIELRFDCCEFIIDRSFPSADIISLFKFTACNNVTLGDVKCSYNGTTRSEIFTRGGQLAQFEQGCSNIRAGNIELNDWAIGLRFARAASDPQSYRCSGVDIQNINAARTGYPLLTTLSGDNLKASLSTDGCGRSYFNYSTSNQRINLRSKNFVASTDVLLYASDGEALTDVELHYTNNASTVTPGGTSDAVHLMFRDITPNIIRNVSIHYTINTDNTVYITNALEVDKLILAGSHDTVDRGHRLENIQVSGALASTGTTTNALSFLDSANWGAGEYVRNIKFKDLLFLGAAQPQFALTSLKDVAEFDNVVYTGPLNIVGNAVGKIILKGVQASNVTLSSGDASLMDFISCNITSGSTQSYTAKNFVNTYINGVLFNSSPQTGRSKFSTVPVGSVAYGSIGTAVNHVAGTIYWAEVFIPKLMTVTGIGILNGGTVGSDKRIVSLYNSTGTGIGNSALAGATSSGANAFQEIALTSTLVVPPGRYWIAVQANGATDNIRCIAASTFIDSLTKSVAGAFGTLSGLTVPTTFTADVGPVAYVY